MPEGKFEEYRKWQRFQEYKRKQTIPPSAFEPQELPTEVKSEERFPTGALIGGTVGSIGGTALGGSLGIPAAGIGAGIGEAIEQKIRGEKPSEEKVGKQVLLGMGGETGGRLALWGGSKLLTPFLPKLSQYKINIGEETQKAINFLDEKMPLTDRKWWNPIRYFSSRYRMKPFMSAEITENRALDILHNVAESSLIGGSRVKSFKLQRNIILEDIAEDIVNTFGKVADADTIGELYIQTVQGNLQASKTAASVLYNQVDEMVKPTIQKGRIENIYNPLTRLVEQKITSDIETGGAKISLRAVKSFAQPLAKLASEVEGIAAEHAGDDIIVDIMKLPNEISYTVAKELRSRLISKTDYFSVTNKKAPAIGKIKQLISRIDDATDEGLATYNPEARDLWREANRIYREGNEQFNNRFIRTLERLVDPAQGGNPEGVVRAIFKPNNISHIKRVKDSLILSQGSQEGQALWNKLQGWFTNDLFAKSTTKEGELIGTNLLNNMFGRGGMGELTLKQIYNPEQLISLKNFATALKLSQLKQGEGTGRMFIQLTQAGATLGLFKPGPVRMTSLAIIVGPEVLARLFTSSVTIDLLTKTIQTTPSQAVVAGTLGRLIAEAGNIKNTSIEKE